MTGPVDYSALCECERWRKGIEVCPVHPDSRKPAPARRWVRVSVVDNTEREAPRIIAQWSPIPLGPNGSTMVAFAQEPTANTLRVRSYELHIEDLGEHRQS